MSLAEQHWRDDNLRADAMRHGYSGSGVGWRSQRLLRERSRSSAPVFRMVASLAALAAFGALVLFVCGAIR